MTNNEVNKYCGKLWGVLPTIEKVVFYKLAEEDKLRYLRDVHEYNTIHGGSIVPK